MEQWKAAALKSAVHVDRRDQLPGNNEKETFVWQGGECRIRGTEKRVLLLLTQKTLYCASRINMSAIVDRLRHKYGVPITTYRYRAKDGSGVYGVYALSSKVRRVNETQPRAHSPHIGYQHREMQHASQ